MYSPSRLFVAILVVVAAVVLFTALMRAQARQPPAPTEAADLRHPLSYVEDKARAAVTGQPIAVRAYTDEIFARSLLAPAASSLKERVFKNELAFRTGGHVGILEQDIVTTVNNHVEQLKAPLFLRLSIGQLQIARQNLLKHVPANSDPAKGSPTQVLSPAEATLVIADLVLQKLYNTEYQVEPEQWEQTVAARRAQVATNLSAVPKPRLIVRPVQKPEYRAVLDTLPDESGDVVKGAHLFLDSIGFAR